MGIYAVSTKSLISELKTVEPDVTEVWFADDSSGAGLLERLKGWCIQLKTLGPSYGYHPKASKTYLIVKDQSMLARAEELFAGEGVQITAERERHIGAALGSENFKTEFVKGKVAKWVLDIDELATYGGAAVCFECLQYRTQSEMNLSPAHSAGHKRNVYPT